MQQFFQLPFFYASDLYFRAKSSNKKDEFIINDQPYNILLF